MHQQKNYQVDQNMEPSIRTVCATQILLGWETLLHGFLSNKLIHCQQQYFTSMKSKKVGIRWGINLTIKLWQMIQKMWIHRNSILHETEAIDLVSGKDYLIEAAFLEHVQGLDDLPTVYAPYFVITLADLLNKPITRLKEWFLVIRSGRESCGTNQSTDIFTTDKSLRIWVGLNPK